MLCRETLSQGEKETETDRETQRNTEKETETDKQRQRKPKTERISLPGNMSFEDPGGIILP